MSGLVAPAWLDELTLRPGPPWLAMGTRGLEPAAWLVVDGRFDLELAEKDRLLQARFDEVFGVADGAETEEAGREVLARVEAWLAVHAPERLATRSAVVPDGLHPLDRAGRLVQEDLCLLDAGRAGPELVLVAASVCFPSHWRIGEKLGRPVAAIHGPVHHYDAELRSRVDSFLARLRPERVVVRRNLSVHSHDELFRPEPHESPTSYGVDPATTWLRSERQTLRRLPGSGAVLFTIKTQQCPVSVLTRRPDVAAALADKLAALTPELVAVGEVVPHPDWLITWLRRVGS